MLNSYVEPKIKSFYQGKTFGSTLFHEVLAHCPRRVIEFGNGLGFTTAVIANALEAQGFGHLTSYDNSLNPRKWVRLYWNLRHHQVSLRFGSLYSWLLRPTLFDLLYVDINNDGSIIRKLTGLNGVVLFEGGSKARDEHSQGKPPINGAAPYTILDPNFPSLSRMGQR